MKSRAMLLAAMLFAVPAFADNDAQNVEGGKPKTEENAAPLTGKPVEDAPNATENKAPEAPESTSSTTEDKSKEAPKAEVSMFQRARELAIAPFAFVLVGAPDYIAKNTLGKLAAIEYLKGGKIAAFLGNAYTGRAAVYAVTAVAAYKVYQAMNPEDDSNDDEDVFGE